MKKPSLHIVLLSFFLLIFVNTSAQKFKLLKGNDSYTTKFKFINNLIIVPIEVNGKELHFILDTGVSVPVIFNLTSSDSLVVNQTEKITIRGLGDGEPLEAFHSQNNKFKLGKIIAHNQDLYVLYKDTFDLSLHIGFPVHGLIGYSLFKDFVVTINYVSKKITFTNPKKYKFKKCTNCETFKLDFYKNKPYIIGSVIINNNDKNAIPVKLLIDSGGSDSVWLFENEKIKAPNKSFNDFIGEGISGAIYGKRSKLKTFALKKFIFNKPNVAFLDTVSAFYARKNKSRNGSVGSDILKRFKVVLDYNNATITLKKNRFFKKQFTYNLSGIAIMYSGKVLVVNNKIDTEFFVFPTGSLNNNPVSYTYNTSYEFKPQYKIYQIRENSPAQKAGVQVGDYIVKINGKHTYKYNLQELTAKFYKNNNTMSLTVNRNGLELNYEFKLEDVLK